MKENVLLQISYEKGNFFERRTFLSRTNPIFGGVRWPVGWMRISSSGGMIRPLARRPPRPGRLVGTRRGRCGSAGQRKKNHLARRTSAACSAALLRGESSGRRSSYGLGLWAWAFGCTGHWPCRRRSWPSLVSSCAAALSRRSSFRGLSPRPWGHCVSLCSSALCWSTWLRSSCRISPMFRRLQKWSSRERLRFTPMTRCFSGSGRRITRRL